MPTPTYIPLATVTLAGTATSVTFSSIPATYRDLVLVVNGSASGLTDITWRANGDTGNNYAYVQMGNSGSSTFSNASSSENQAKIGNFGTGQSTGLLQIMDYSATDKHKTALGRGNDTGSNLSVISTRWANTDAITSVIIGGATYNSGTTFSLYGIAS